MSIMWQNYVAGVWQATTGTTTAQVRTSVAVITISSAAFVVPKLYKNYQDWKALGKSGLPTTPSAWALQHFLRMFFSRETRSTTVYDEPWNDKYTKNLSPNEVKVVGTSYLAIDSLPSREGDRPFIPDFAVPQREQPPMKDSTLEKAQEELITILANENPTTTVVGPSKLENGCPALFITEQVPAPKVAINHKREICHGHLDIDRSMHCTLSYADAKQVIEKGWGERHPLSGSPILGPSYVMLYAPRNQEELEVLGLILRAGVKFMIALV